MSEDEKIVKHILYIWGNAEEICREKKERVYELLKMCDAATDIHSAVIDNMPKKKNNSSFVENSVIKNIDVYEKTIFKLQQDIKEIMSIKAIIDSRISFLQKDEKKIIILRYKDGLSWDYIPDIIHKSRMQCFRIHNRILSKWKDDSLFSEIK